jgi:hypothetical protein
MMPRKERYSIRWIDGTVRSVTAQSHRGAKKAFMDEYDTPPGKELTIWPQSSPYDKRTFRT